VRWWFCFLNDSCAENTLILKAVEGSDKAFELLMNAHLKVIYNYICIHIKRDDDIQDIVQETMLAAWSGLKSFRKNSSFKTWIIGIARRKICDHYRSKYRILTVSIFDEFDEKDSLRIEDESDKSIEVIDINKAVESLNSKEQELVFLAFNAQLTYQEISEVIQVPVGTVKSRMSTIRCKLRKHLERE
jgi:RNA polymerase sigma-70 factor (ECF subfamily)